ncbi:MAG TPA: hypothetical protein VGF32_07105 [Streptosporangiaceae bacterium]|jgi:hypothetical protein
MAVRELVTRHPDGTGPDGEKRYASTYTGRPDIRTLQDWVEVRLLVIRSQARGQLREVLEQLLLAGDDKARKAAVTAGKGLDPRHRWTVYLALKHLVKVAQSGTDFHGPLPAAAALMQPLERDWAARWGSKEPPPARAPREQLPPAAGAKIRVRGPVVA